jgi:hypothetical protein
MPVETTVDDSRQLTIFTICESLNFGDVEQSMKTFYAGVVTRNVLWDIQNADVTEFDSGQIQRLASLPLRFTEERKGGKTAIVASTDLAFGLSRMFQIFGETKDLPFLFRVFRTTEDALKWIDED